MPSHAAAPPQRLTSLDWALNQITNADAKAEIQSVLHAYLDRAVKAEKILAAARAEVGSLADKVGLNYDYDPSDYDPSEDDS